MARASLGAMPLKFSSLFNRKPPQVLISLSPFSTSLHRNALRPPNIPLPKDEDPSYNNTHNDSSRSNPSRRSRNELKREARRSVKWGMELAKFNNSQIKRVLRVAGLDEDVFDALMLVKRLGPDVREGKRRQFNYIGRLLREAEPELMEALIQASRDGDNNRLQALTAGTSKFIEADEAEEDMTYEDEENIDDEGSGNHIEVAARWFDGLIYRDQSITKEVYSVHNIEYDRQELRKLVRQVQSIQEALLAEESDTKDDSKLTRAKKPLIRFLRSLAKQSLVE
ncbi:uncharacterized protein LOC109836864 [Asparagus officinalis]|uniref:uncharacterized protein LOC109836864 n=1 Tax=Asparagus officinalis TaxID=4686 RepID=UPI00098E102E|nr:uncharacterized protein LOC109836864 [Asparagus officinalis]